MSRIVSHGPPLADDSHLNILPDCAVNVIVPALLPKHTCASLDVVPPIGGASKVMVTVLLLGGHDGEAVMVHINVYCHGAEGVTVA